MGIGCEVGPNMTAPATKTMAAMIVAEIPLTAISAGTRHGP